MKMARIHWLNGCPDPITKAQAAVSGWDSKFTADSVVRYYLNRSLCEAVADLGLDPLTTDQVEIVAGIGTLTMAAAGNTFIDRRTGQVQPPPPQPRPAPPDLVASRSAVCCACDRYDLNNDKCLIAGCRCGGGILGNPTILSGRCPLQRW
jgi:hypothetical protein